MALDRMIARIPQKKQIRPIYHPGKMYTSAERTQNRKAWIEALRSGKYIQHKSHLKGPNNTFSAFGVAADILGCVEELCSNGDYVFAGYTIAIPFEAEMALGLHGEEGDNENECKPSILDLNYFDKTFNEIADILEREDCGYFLNV